MRILVLTLCIGEDYRRSLVNCLKSKEEYCKKQSYDYVLGGEEWWDRTRPISWSKIKFLLHYLRTNSSCYDLIFMSDADVLITNYDIRLEDVINEVFPANKLFLLSEDACGNWNSGNIMVRPGDWTIDFLERVWARTDDIYHIWWESKAIQDILMESLADKEKAEISKKHWLFNAYLRGLPEQRLWNPGDFLVHFAGVYDPKKIGELTAQIQNGDVPRLTW